MGDRYVRAHLIGISDLHGYLADHGLRYTDPYTGITAPAGGAGVLAMHIRGRRHRHMNPTFLVHSGDMVGGGPPKGALLRDEPVIRVLNGLGFLAGTPGNHEFDRGLPELLRLTRGDEEFAGQNFPLISANIVETATGRPVFRPGLTVGIQGVPVAFVGATTVFTPALTSPGATDWLTFLDEAGAIDRQVSHLRDQGVQAVVLLLHEGGKQTSFPSGTVSPRVSEITAAVPGLKVVPAGHTHHTLNSQVKGCLVVQPAPNQFWEWPSGTLLVVAGRQVSTPVSWTLSPDERQCPCR